MFDKMYLQECEVYFAGDLVGSNSEGELYKGLVCFKIVGLKNTTPYVIKLSSETKINADWLKEELKDCLGILSQSGFSVRAIVCDNHPSNDSSFKKPATTLFYDAAHLVKNIRNNLLKYIRFIFSSFKFDSFKDLINLPDGETKWKFFHDVHEKDAFLEANLKKAPNPTTKVLHPGNCKQNVPTALAISHGTTAAAIQSYFPYEISTAKFLKLFSKWWVISNSKTTFSTNNYLGNAAVNGNQKPSFLRAMTE